MSRTFEELARTDTPLGEIVLRRRLEPISQRDIFEVILAGDGLMSSLFTHGERLGSRLRPQGVFALWSNDPPDADFLADLHACFADADAHIVSFWNFLTDDQTRSTIYVATVGA